MEVVEMRAFGIAVVLVALVSPLAAQEASEPNRHPHRGFWASLGFAAGAGSQDCAGCPDEAIGGPAGYLRLGGTVTQKVRMGAELVGWRGEGDDNDEMGGALFDIVWYPGARSGLYLKFGFGAMGYQRSTFVAGDFARVVETSAAFSFGLGYDVRISRNISITPFLDGYSANGSQRSVDGVDTSSPSSSMAMIGAAITLH